MNTTQGRSRWPRVHLTCSSWPERSSLVRNNSKFPQFSELSDMLAPFQIENLKETHITPPLRHYSDKQPRVMLTQVACLGSAIVVASCVFTFLSPSPRVPTIFFIFLSEPHSLQCSTYDSDCWRHSQRAFLQRVTIIMMEHAQTWWTSWSWRSLMSTSAPMRTTTCSTLTTWGMHGASRRPVCGPFITASTTVTNNSGASVLNLRRWGWRQISSYQVRWTPQITRLCKNTLGWEGSGGFLRVE